MDFPLKYKKNYANINNEARRVGGIVGAGLTMIETNKSLTINECVNNGKITGSSMVGGIIGVCSFVTINKSTNNAIINATGYILEYGTEEISEAGGIIGGIGSVGDNKINYCIYSKYQ